MRMASSPVAWLACLALLAGTGSAAEETDLSGGVFIAHRPAALAYTSDTPPEKWCLLYGSENAVINCSEQSPASASDAGDVWYVLSAWPEAKRFAGIQFGFGDYDPGLFTFTAWGPCFPSGGLELPHGGWPAPNAGTAVAIAGEPWVGNFVPVYFFCGYAYGEGRIPLTPTWPFDFAGWANQETDEYAAVCLGEFGIGAPGVECCPGGLSSRDAAAAKGARLHESAPAGTATTWGALKLLYGR